MSEVVEAKTKDGEQEILLNDDELKAAEAAASRLAALEDEEPAEDVKPAEPKAKVTTPTPEDKSDTEDEPKAEDVTPAEEPTPDKTELPDKYRRAAVHQGWTTEEIDKFVKSDPELAVKTLEKLYVSTNKISQDFARIGRGSAKDTGTKNESAEFKPVDLTEMKKAYGDDDPAIKTIQALQDQIATMSRRTSISDKPANTQAANNELLTKTIDTFFTASDMSPYTEFYGKGKFNDKTLTIEQSERRWELLNTADQIRDGAASQGVAMGVDEALERAHLIVADSFKSQALRTKLVTELKTKSKGATLKPKGGKDADLSKTDPAKHLEDKTAARLAAMKFKE
jgi:hypothetical protein